MNRVQSIKKIPALERNTANYIQMAETEMVLIFKELEILCSVNGGKDLRRNRKIKFAWKSPRLLDSFSIK